MIRLAALYNDDIAFLCEDDFFSCFVKQIDRKPRLQCVRGTTCYTVSALDPVPLESEIIRFLAGSGSIGKLRVRLQKNILRFTDLNKYFLVLKVNFINDTQLKF
jgi:hypothetical protein